MNGESLSKHWDPPHTASFNNTLSNSLDGLCGVVVTYHPTGDVMQRLAVMASIVDELVIIDNSADDVVLLDLNAFVAQHKVSVVANQRNLGVATALNRGVACAKRRNVKWVLFFDQDSRPISTFRQEMCRVISEYRGTRPLGIIGCNYVEEHNSRIKFPVSVKGHSHYVSVNSVITSGSIYSVGMIESIGLFKDKYFIDLVDIEYCWRASRLGYAVVRALEPLMEHGIGRITRHRVLGIKADTSNHSAFRRYFMARNTVFLAKEYFRAYPLKVIKIVILRVISTIVMCIFEKERHKKAWYTLTGLWDGVLGKAGPRPNIFN